MSAEDEPHNSAGEAARGHHPGRGGSRSLLGGRARLIPLVRHTDVRGTLVPLELSSLPFEPRRIFVIGDVEPGTTRGRHAHRHGRQLLVCLAGNIDVELRWHEQSAIVTLEPLDAGLLIEAGVWAAQTYRIPGTVLLGLASEAYEPPEEQSV